MGIGEQARMASNAAKHGRCLVVHIAPNLLLPKNGVVFRRRNLVASEVAEGLIADVIEVHRQIELLIQIVFDALVGQELHDLGHVIESHVAVEVLFLAQRGLGHRVENAVGIVVDEIKVFGHPHVVALVDDIGIILKHRPVLVHRHLIKRYPCLQAGLVRHNVDELQLAVRLALQIGKKISQRGVQVNQPVVI